jgi:hypothetical protein
MGRTIKVSGCDIIALNDTSASSYDLDGPVDVGPVVYTRAATHRSIPAAITITHVSAVLKQVEITTKIARWSLYYKEITSDNKRATFKDGTVFTVDGATLTVTSCIRGLKGKYTTSADPLVDGTTVYSIAGSSTAPTDIPRSVSCNWGKRVFSIGVDGEHTVECGERTFTQTSEKNSVTFANAGTPVAIGVHASGPDSDRQPNARFAYTSTAEPACITTNSFHPFAKEVAVININSWLSSAWGTHVIACHGNSARSTVVPTRECVKGRWRVPVGGGDDVLQCTPGPAQKFINVSGFTMAETIFNGAYQHEQNERESTTKWPVWTHTTNNITRIVISEAIGNMLELRDKSDAVGYTIAIINKTVTNPALEVYDTNTSPRTNLSSTTENTTSSIIRATFSATGVYLSPCDLWSQCVEANMDTSKTDGSTLLACADHVRSCADVRPVGQSLTGLITSTGAARIDMLPIVANDFSGPLFGRGAGITGTTATTAAAATATTDAATTTTTTTSTNLNLAAMAKALTGAGVTLYVVIPMGAAVNGQKAKVLVIGSADSATVVRDATLAIVPSSSFASKTWTIDAQVATAKPTEKPAAETAKPAAETAKPAAETAKPAAETAKPAAETAKPATVVVPCADLLACLSLPASTSSLGFSACAARAVSCAAPAAAVGAAARVLSGDKLMYNSGGVELYRLSTVLYGTDKDNAYVIVHGDLTKGRLLVAPLNNGTAIVVDVEKNGSLATWTVVADNTTMWIGIGVGVGVFAAIILVIVLVVALSRKRARRQL